MLAMFAIAAGILVWGFSGGDGGSTSAKGGDGPIVNGASGGTRIADADVSALADEMTAGFKAKDFAAYAAAFQMSPQDRAAQQQLFDNWQLVPFSRFEIVALDFNARAFDSGGGKVQTKAEVAMVHTFDGADLTAVSEAYELDLVKAGPKAKVQVVGIKGVDSGGSLYPQLWDRGPIHVAVADRAIVLGSAADAGLIDSRVALISAGAGQALDELAGSDPRPLPRKVVVSVPGEGKDAYDVYQGDSPDRFIEARGMALDQLNAPYDDIEGNPIDSGSDELDTFEGAGRVALDRKAVADGGLELAAVAKHETTHLVQFAWQATNTDTQEAFDKGEDTWATSDLPRWMTEGFADYVSRGYLADATRSYEYAGALAAARKPGFKGMPKGTDDFYDAPLEEVNARYGLGMSAFMYVEATKGRDVAVKWGHALFNAPSLKAVDRTYSEVLGTTPQAFEAAWSSWLRGRA
jgi:hypothetical protein